MDKASYIVEVQYTKQGGTYSAMLVSDYGDIYQQYTSYDPNTKQATGISPSFETNPPTVELAIFSSKKSGSEIYPSKGSVAWHVANTLLTFNDEGISTNTFNGETGHFQLIDADAKAQRRAGLKIIKNVVVASQATPFNIMATATIANGMSSASVSASTNVGIKLASVGASVVNIRATNGGLVSASDPTYASTVLTAEVSAAEGSPITSGFKYQWYANNNETGVMEMLTGKTAQMLTVTPSDVNQSRMYKVVVTGASGGNVGWDTQLVKDISDPLRIVPNPTPEDEQIIEGDPTHAQVKWKPVVMMNDTVIPDSKVAWKFVLYEPEGSTVYDEPITDKDQFVVTEEVVSNVGNVQVAITATVTL